jgi:opacity protein-like surface antigen
MSNFEEDLKNMFDGADFAPSDQLWLGIEGALKAKKKKGILLYWQTYGVAAALALILTFAFLFNKEPNNDVKPSAAPLTELKDKLEEQKVETKADAVIDTIGKPQPSNSFDKSKASIEQRDNVHDNTKSANSSIVNQKLMALANDDKGIKLQLGNERIASSELISSSDLILGQIESSQFASIILPQLPASISIIKARWEAKHLVAPMHIESSTGLIPEANFEKLVSLNGGIGSSSFDPNASGTSSQFSTAELRSDDEGIGSSSFLSEVRNGDNQQLGSFAVGAGVGIELNPRWSLVISARFSEYRFANESNAYSIESQGNFPIYIPAGFDGDIALLPNYQLTSSLISIAVPIQAAYKIVDIGRFDLDVKAGLSFDYFLSFKVKGDLPFLSTRKVEFSNSSLFKRFNLGSTGGLGFNYKLNEQWGLSADIFARKFIGDLNEEGNYKSRPFVYGFSFNLRYFLLKENN